MCVTRTGKGRNWTELKILSLSDFNQVIYFSFYRWVLPFFNIIIRHTVGNDAMNKENKNVEHKGVECSF